MREGTTVERVGIELLPRGSLQRQPQRFSVEKNERMNEVDAAVS